MYTIPRPRLFASLALTLVLVSALFSPVRAEPSPPPASPHGPNTFLSDDFSTCDEFLAAQWVGTDPLGDATIETTGTHVTISFPEGKDRDIWGTGPADFANGAPRFMQPAVNEDFEVEIKFDSVMDSRFQTEGFLVMQDALNWLRFEFHHDGTTVRITAISILNGEGTIIQQDPIASTGDAPLIMRVKRTGDIWAQSYSLDQGASFIDHTTFTTPFVVTEVGFYAGSTILEGDTQTPPAFTGVFDYFFNTAAPITPEDGPLTITAGVQPAGSGSVSLEPQKDVYTCNETVAVTAIPNEGWLFDHWEGELTGTQSSGSLTMHDSKTITAVFAPETTERFLYLPVVVR